MGVRSLDDATLPEYLVEKGVFPRTRSTRIEPAGDGNINWVRRAVSEDGNSWVVKQARPALEAFPEYSVSTERIVFEARYFEVVAAFDSENVCPRIELFDPLDRILVLEDLTNSQRLDRALSVGADVAAPLASLSGFLGRVHAGTRSPELAARFANDEMRRLHGDHIFLLPYRDNDFPLSPAVARRAKEIRADRKLISLIDSAHGRYLDPHGALNHADVQPTNILLTERGPKLIDAEIAHVGDPAFDVGVLLAHLMLAALAGGDADSARGAVRMIWSSYQTAHANLAPPPFREVSRYAGIEVLRRTIGAARVPAVERDETALAALETGARLVTSPPEQPESFC